MAEACNQILLRSLWPLKDKQTKLQQKQALERIKSDKTEQFEKRQS